MDTLLKLYTEKKEHMHLKDEVKRLTKDLAEVHTEQQTDVAIHAATEDTVAARYAVAKEVFVLT